MSKEEILLDLLGAQAKVIRELIIDKTTPILATDFKKPDHDGLKFAKKIVMRCKDYSLSCGYDFKRDQGYDPFEDILNQINKYLGIAK